MSEPMHIREVISRRYDLSTFVVHLTRDFNGIEAKENLKSILSRGMIEARTVMGIAKSYVEGCDISETTQRAVSFSEAPLDQLWSFVVETDPPRQIQLSKFGIAFPRQVARKRGINPVWYIDKTVGRRWLHGPDGSDRPLNRLIEKTPPGTFYRNPMCEICPLIEPMGTWERRQREFYWEREWRKRGSLSFQLKDLAFGLCPEEEIEYFEEWAKELRGHSRRKYPLRFVDPTWGLEEILAVLSGMEWSDFSPFMTSK